VNLWLPGYEHRPVPGAGLSVGRGRPKVGSHTTETGPGSFDVLERHWRANWGAGLPHFLQEGARITQFLPLNVGAYTAKNRDGGADINRSGPMIQIETIAYAAQGWNDATYEAFGRWLADLQTAGVDFDINEHPRFYGPNEGIVLAREDSPIRLSAGEFEAFNGWLGHQHFPENDHWDPGGIDADRIVRIARAHLDAPTDPVADPEDDETMPAAHFVLSDGSAYASDGVTATWLRGGAVTALAWDPFPGEEKPAIGKPRPLNAKDSADFLLTFFGLDESNKYAEKNPG
jgi:hypothetical protein